MYTKLVLFRNELKNKNISNYKRIGMVAELLFSKTIFPKNCDIAEFLKQVFQMEYKEYVMRSRTLIVAKVSRQLYEEESVNYSKPLLDFISEQIQVIKQKENIKDKRNDFAGWIK